MEVTADPVYGIDGISLEAAKALLREEGIDSDKHFLGVAVRQWKKAPALASKIAYVADRAYEELGIDILFTPLHYPEDKHFAEAIKTKMVHRNHCHVLSGNYAVEEMEGIIGLCDLIIGMRLHALIYAVTSKTPAVGIVYDPKVKAQLDSLAIPSDICAEGMDEKKLLNAVVAMYRKRTRSGCVYEPAMGSFWKKAGGMCNMSSNFCNPKDKIKIFNTAVDDVSEEESRRILSDFIDKGGFHWVFTPNTEIVMALKGDREKARVMNGADLVVPDGIGLVIGSKMGGHPLKERVTGYDLSLYLLELAREKNKTIFFRRRARHRQGGEEAGGGKIRPHRRRGEPRLL